MRVPRQASTGPQGLRLLEQGIERWAEVRVTEKTANGVSSYVIDAHLEGERERAQELVLVLGQPKGEGLQGLFFGLLHQCTIAETMPKVSFWVCGGVCALASGGASTAETREGYLAASARTMRERAVRVQIRLPAGLHRSLEECAERSGLSTAGLVRLFLEEGLAGAPTTAVEALKSRRGAGDLVSLSTLVASEHLLKLIELITPGAIRVTRDARAQAFGAARQRLDEVRAQVEDEV